MTSFEVTLPRGSAVMHLYAVTALSHNQVESAWPANSKQFIAVAAPQLAVPAAPTVEATADPTAAPPRVRLRLWPGRGPAPSRIDVYRTTKESLAAAANAMGPPVGSAPVNDAELTFDDEQAPVGWRRLRYRAVAWTTYDDSAGRVGSRSSASAAVSALLPPAEPPTVVDLSLNKAGSTDAECLVAWKSDMLVSPTPLGPHSVVVETTDEVGNPIVRLEGQLDRLPTVANLASLPPADPDHRAIFRVEAEGATTQFATWVLRPAADEPFHLTVKLIDPLRRIGREAREVPPLPPG